MRERPFIAAERHRQAGLTNPQIVEAMCRDGHERAEAMLAVNSLPAVGPQQERSAVELEKKEHGDRAYFLVLLGTTVTAGGLLLTLTGWAGVVGPVVLVVGAVLLGRGWWRWYLGAR